MAVKGADGRFIDSDSGMASAASMASSAGGGKYAHLFEMQNPLGRGLNVSMKQLADNLKNILGNLEGQKWEMTTMPSMSTPSVLAGTYNHSIMSQSR